MPITRGAKKALRASKKKRVFNLVRKDKVSKAVKSLKKLVTEKNYKEATLAMREVQKALDKAVKGHTLDKNTASRKKSRLSKMVKKIK
ncbi:MAG: 30S ribosomal protein S20 [Minisyncoccota bacterium]